MSRSHSRGMRATLAIVDKRIAAGDNLDRLNPVLVKKLETYITKGEKALAAAEARRAARKAKRATRHSP